MDDAVADRAARRQRVKLRFDLRFAGERIFRFPLFGAGAEIALIVAQQGPFERGGSRVQDEDGTSIVRCHESFYSSSRCAGEAAHVQFFTSGMSSPWVVTY